MSDPNQPEITPEPTAPSYAEPFTPLPTPRKRRPLVIGGVVMATLVALGGGAFAAWWFLSGGGPQPEEALPDSTIAVISIDLDPSAGQKIEAIKTLRKFPAFKDELNIESRDDLREFVFDKALGEDCGEISFDDDLKPWLGERAALAAVDLREDDPVPAVVLAITDTAKAKAGIDAVIDCADGDDAELGFALSDDFAIFSDSTEHAERILADGRKNPLSENKQYQSASDEVDDRGVVNFYVAKAAADLLTDAFEEFSDGFTEGFGSEFGDEDLSGTSGTSVPTASGCDPFGPSADSLATFEGLAGTIRFDDGGTELEVVGLGLGQNASNEVGSRVQKLPADTALALGTSVGGDIGELVELVDDCEPGLVDEIEDNLGVTLPDDLKTLLGTSLSLSVGEDVPADLAGIDDPTDLPVGLVIHGDGDQIKAVIDKLDRKLQETQGLGLSDLDVKVESKGDKVIITPSQEYLDALGSDGDLGGSENFENAVPDADRASAVLYVNFDSKLKDALLQLVEDEGEAADDVQKVRENLDPLSSLGLSSWQQDGDGHFLLKITTD